MTWPFNDRVATATVELLGDRTSGRSVSRRVSRSEAMRHSAVWACLRLRADLISTMPVDIFRRVGGVQLEVAKPPLFVTPGGSEVLWSEWAYSTQVDLDSNGNTVGVITAIDVGGMPSVIELANADAVTFVGKGGKMAGYRIGGKDYEPHEIWHEKQYTLSGVPFGLSPIAHAAMSLNPAMSAMQFAAEWFGNSTLPGGHLKNTAKVLKRSEARKAKAAFKSSVEAGDVWVSGNDWEFKQIGATAADSQFLSTIKASVPDVCRFLGVPADMIDADAATGNITYANVTQRNLQLLIMNIGPAIARREASWTHGLLANPRYAKLNTDALQRMDLKSRWESYKVGVDGRWMPPSRILDLENQPPLSAEEEAEFARLFPKTSPAPATQGVTS